MEKKGRTKPTRTLNSCIRIDRPCVGLLIDDNGAVVNCDGPVHGASNKCNVSLCRILLLESVGRQMELGHIECGIWQWIFGSLPGWHILDGLVR